MGIPDSKNVLASFWMETGESWVFYSGKPEANFEPKSYSHDGTPYVSTKCYAGAGKNGVFTSEDYILFAVQTSGQDATVNEPTPVIVLGPDQESVTTLPYEGSILEGVLGARLNYDKSTKLYSLWYYVYGWTNDKENTNVLASYPYTDETVEIFDPENWWVIPQIDRRFPKYTKAAIVLLFTTGQKVVMDGNVPYLVFKFPKVSWSYETVGDSLCVSVVEVVGAIDSTSGMYPGRVQYYNVIDNEWSEGEDCWVVNANT